MSTYSQLMYQIVFGPYQRQPVLTKPGREELYKYISEVNKNAGGH